MDWYYYIGWVFILSQVTFLGLLYLNYRYALKKYGKRRARVCLKTVVIVPCRGAPPGFEDNISSFFKQDYEHYSLWFVVRDAEDPAYAKLAGLKERLEADSKAQDVRVLVAGAASGCSQKVHNLLFACRHVGEDTQALAFADADICVPQWWLAHLAYPLHQDKTGATTGYRWFVPRRNNTASLVLSALNGKIAQLLGPSHFNQAWGGSMAIRLETFKRLGLEKIWSSAVSDDLTLSRAVKKAGLKLVFVPGCLVPSYEQVTWAQLFEFARRQFLITRVTVPWVWLSGLLSSAYSVSGLYGGAALAFYMWLTGVAGWALFAVVAVVFFAGHLWRAGLRQHMARRVLAEHRSRMRLAALVDLLGSWLVSVLLLGLLLSSAFGRRIRWAGITYKLLGPQRTVIECQ